MIRHRLRRLRMSVLINSLPAICFLFSPLVSLALASEAPASKAPEVIFAISSEQQQPAPASSQAQQPPNTPAPQNPPQQQKPPAQNPFENVPVAPEKPNQPPGQQNPGGIQEAKPAAIDENTVEAVEFRGQRKVPQDTLRALIFTKKGDVYDAESLHRDFMALWNTGRFDDLRVERDRGPAGGIILRFVVTERRTVHTIDYTGNKSISKSEILDRFKERKVALTPESQYDPGRVQRARNVLQEYEAERGHQYASVTPQIRQVPPGGVDITFQIDEGPKVKVGHIEIEGNSAFPDKAVIRAMKNLKPIGIPHSLIFENLFARTYDSTKLDEDSDRVRQFYQVHGYFTARIINHSEKVYEVSGHGIKIPLINPKKPGKRVDITMVVREGEQYHLRNFNFVGMKLFRTPDLIGRQVFGMAPGDIFSTEKLQKGIENLRKLYGNFGYIDMVPSPDPQTVANNQIDLTIDVDEGKQFFVRRIDFQGNTTTRDKVIRREMLIDEGDLYSQQLFDTSVLRLNQLGYFDPLKPEDAADVKRDTRTNTVDLLLKVKERGRNSIQLNGGVSGISGSFLGFSYSTNNFLGLGETLSLGAQIGTLLTNITFGFTEPYLFDKPIQAGFTLFYQRYRFDQATQYSIFAGANYTNYLNATIGAQNLLNYTTNGKGFTSFLSYALKRSFARVGLTYGYSVQSVVPISEAAKNQFLYYNFQGLSGPNSLEGITQSTITPTYAYNTVNHPIIPTRGLRINLSAGFSGSILGGNVNTITPALDIAYFRRGIFRNHVMGFHLNGRFIGGYGGKVAPPYSRFYMGGEDDVRGFNIYSISPFVYLPTDASVPVLNNDGTTRVQRVVNADGSIGTRAVTQTIPTYQFTYAGGDTAVVFNYEYRIPIVGPVTLAPFLDAGVNRISLPNQLTLNSDRVGFLNGLFPQADFGNKAYIVPGSQIPRVSAGLELQVLMPVVNAPFRLYWAYNLSTFSGSILPPIVTGPSYFPNDATYKSALRALGVSQGNYNEKRSLFRFSIGRTF